MGRLAFLILIACLGCESTPYRWAETDLDGGAPGAAYAGAAMFSRKPMTDRRDFRAWDFYYKHCAIGDNDRPWATKNAYECNGPN